MNDLPIICILGPTASGKTALSLKLAEDYPIEIINVDSAQIYQGLDIGSGKPKQTVLQSIPHHLIDILDPSESYSVWRFRQDALAAIENIKMRGKIPLLVGGTMLYFKALQQGLSELPASTPEVRKKIETLSYEQGEEYVYNKLRSIDPITASRLAPADQQRISRALEVYEMTGKTLSEWVSQAPASASSYPFINIALIPQETPRNVLHHRIQSRFDEMLREGLIEETRALQKRGDLHENLPAIRAVGYRQMWGYLNNLYSFEEMRDKSIAATRQLAKRQLTWLRQWPECQECDFMDLKRAYGMIEPMLAHTVA